jgi:ribokinase
MKKVKAAVLGSINFDSVAKAERLPKTGETVRGISYGTYVGGKGANQSVQLSLLGADVTFIGKIGDDEIGQTLKKSLQNHGINTEFQRVEKGVNSGACNINLDSEGHNTLLYAPGANERISIKDIDDAARAISSADIFITQNEINLDAVEYGLKTAKKFGITTFLNPAPALELPGEIYKLVDYILPNETEAETYCGFPTAVDEKALRRSAEWFLARGVKKVVITLGENGVFYFDGKESALCPAFKIKAVDTTAAGDAYIGGFAYTVGKGGALAEAMRFGNACGALAASKQGAQVSLPSYEAVLEFLKSNT